MGGCGGCANCKKRRRDGHGLTRRDFLKQSTLFMGAAAAGQFVPPMRFSFNSATPGVLAPSDITYLGSIKVPAFDGSPMQDSNGCMAIRRGMDGNGALTFLMSGSTQLDSGWATLDTLFEFNYPGESIGTPTQATMIQQWSDIYNGKGTATQVMQTINAPWNNPPNDGAPILYGLDYDQSTNELIGAYQTPYNGVNNPAIFKVALSANTAIRGYGGPWRPSVTSQKTGYIVAQIPPNARSNFGGKTRYIASPQHTTNAGCHFGMGLHICDIPSISTPASDTFNQNDDAFTATSLIDYDFNTPQPRPATGPLSVHNLLICGWNCNTGSGPGPGCSDIYDPSGGCNTHAAQSYFGLQTPGSAQNLDLYDRSIWIDNGKVRGIISIGQFIAFVSGYTYLGSDPANCHSWYGPTSGGSSGQCCHGQVDNSLPSTGPGAGTMLYGFSIWDPNKLIPVYNGAASTTSVLPDYNGQFVDICSEGPNYSNGSGYRFIFGGACFDAQTNKLFISVRGVDKYGCCTYVPRIFVFQIAH